MGSKGIVIFGIFLALVLSISSEVAARELVKTSHTIITYKKTSGGALDSKLPDYNRAPCTDCGPPTPLTRRGPHN
ncbi:hypothetical protein CDL12_11001 [Handroanthus impetiginosus]|uniref:Uncharacterized protein n=1 Tax=Handroanthus impetiginosus TaxID=429701 RepID=A0A2G9HFN2_9LAMI|nr:hypothetical protein CDL12_11001 [Handroanthus impetiginosus]